jgi:hypothetical protein
MTCFPAEDGPEDDSGLDEDGGDDDDNPGQDYTSAEDGDPGEDGGRSLPSTTTVVSAQLPPGGSASPAHSCPWTPAGIVTRPVEVGPARHHHPGVSAANLAARSTALETVFAVQARGALRSS